MINLRQDVLSDCEFVIYFKDYYQQTIRVVLLLSCKQLLFLTQTRGLLQHGSRLSSSLRPYMHLFSMQVTLIQQLSFICHLQYHRPIFCQPTGP